MLLISTIAFKKKRKVLIRITIISFFILTNGFIADNISRLWEYPTFEPKDTYDIGIVLGGFSNYDRKTKHHNFNAQADRLMYAQQLYQQ